MAVETFDSKLSHTAAWQNEGRIRKVKVSTQFLFEIIKHGLHGPVEVVEGLPPDAILVGGHYDSNYGTHPYFVLLVASSEFTPAELGLPYPEVTVTFRAVYPHAD